MKCITSPALDDIQIVAYVDGEADDSVAAHIEICSFCAERARQWRLLQNRLQRQLYRATCPTPVELGDYHLGLMESSRTLVVAQHVRECPLCQREVADLQEFLAEPAAPRGFVEAAKVLIAQLGGGATTPAQVHLRGEDRGPLIFEADGVVITLEIQPDPDGQSSILGQLAAEEQDEWTGAEVELEQLDSTKLMTSLDDLGAFRWDHVGPGVSRITIRSPHNIVVHISSLDIPI
jgi:hypothetical protein